jgi:hypothetical protein
MLYWPPPRLPIKEIPGEPGFQSAASDGHRHTPRDHNLNYTIWTLYAESVGFPVNVTLLWGTPKPIYQATWDAPTPIINLSSTLARPSPIYQANWGAPTQIKLLGARAVKSIKLLGVRPLQSVKQLGSRPLQSIKHLGARPF